MIEIKRPEVDFDAKGHVYRRKSDGYLLTGTTTILEVRQKPFLKWWTAKMVYEYLLPRLKEVQGITEKQWEALLLEAKKAHVRKSDEAKNVGKEVHQFIEKYINAKIEKKIPNTEVKDMPDSAQHAIFSFLKWEEENDAEWLASEVLVASDKHLFAGTVDFIAMVDGKLTLGDFKTSSMISEDAYLQTAAYQICLEEKGVEPEQRLIIRIPKTGEKVEARIVPSDLQFDKDTFLACREIHRWNLLQDKLKEENKYAKTGKTPYRATVSPTEHNKTNFRLWKQLKNK